MRESFPLADYYYYKSDEWHRTSVLYTSPSSYANRDYAISYSDGRNLFPPVLLMCEKVLELWEVLGELFVKCCKSIVWFI